MNLSIPPRIAASVFVALGWASLPDPHALAQSPQGPGVAGAATEERPSRLGEQKPELLTSDQAQDLVTAAIKSFYEGIVANDNETRLKALKSLQPTEKHIAALFGQKHGAMGLDVIKPRIEAMLTHVDKVSAQLGRDGRFVSCELEELKIPTSIEQRALSALMQDIDPETFRFKAQIRTERARSSSGSYYVIDRAVVYIEDKKLIQIARRINANR